MKYLLLILLLLPQAGWGADFYIAQTAAGSADGTSCGNAFAVTWLNTSGNWANPKTAGKFGPGDTAWICGTITSTITAQNSGSSGSPITIKGVDKATSIISGNTTGIDTTGKTYLTIQSLSFYGQTGTNSRAILTANGTNEIIIDDFDIDGNGTAQYGILNSGATVGNVTISNGTIKKVTNGSTNGKGLSFNSVTSASTFTVQNVTVGGTLADGCNVGFYANGVSNAIFHVSNLNISYSLTPGGYAGFHVQNSTLGNGSYFNDLKLSNSQANSNFQWNGGGNTTFNGLDSSYSASTDNTLGTGIQIYSSAAATSGITFIGGRTHHNQNDGAGVYQATNALSNITFRGMEIDNNGVLGDANRGDGLTGHGAASNIFVENCFIHDNYLTAIAFVETTTGHIYNLTSVDNGASGTRAGLYFGNSGGTGWTVKNSIIYHDLPYAVYLSTGASTITTFDHNVYHLSDTATGFALINTTATDWDTWSATYDTAGSQVADPLFKSTTDFRLRSSSPCRSAGVYITGYHDIYRDMANKVWKSPGPSIGAYEFYPVDQNTGYGWKGKGFLRIR